MDLTPPARSVLVPAAIVLGLLTVAVGLRALWYQVCPVGAPDDTLRSISDQALIATSTDVFVGRVVDRTGFSNDRPDDDCVVLLHGGLYAVEVLQTVDGTAAGLVQVREAAAPILRRERRDDDAPLDPGETAFFVARFDRGRAVYDLLAGARARFRIGGDRNHDELVARFEAVLATPRPPPPPGPPPTPEAYE